MKPLAFVLFFASLWGALCYSLTYEEAEHTRAFMAEMEEIGRTPVVVSPQAEEIASGLMTGCSLEGIAGGGYRGRAWLSASDIQLLEVTLGRRILAQGLSASLYVTLPVEAPTVRLLEEVTIALMARVEACRPILHAKDSERPAGPTTIPHN